MSSRSDTSSYRNKFTQQLNVVCNLNWQRGSVSRKPLHKNKEQPEFHGLSFSLRRICRWIGVVPQRHSSEKRVDEKKRVPKVRMLGDAGFGILGWWVNGWKCRECSWIESVNDASLAINGDIVCVCVCVCLVWSEAKHGVNAFWGGKEKSTCWKDFVRRRQGFRGGVETTDGVQKMFTNFLTGMVSLQWTQHSSRDSLHTNGDSLSPRQGLWRVSGGGLHHYDHESSLAAIVLLVGLTFVCFVTRHKTYDTTTTTTHGQRRGETIASSQKASNESWRRLGWAHPAVSAFALHKGKRAEHCCCSEQQQLSLL